MPVYCVSINFVLENELIKYRLTCLFYSLISPKLTLYWWTERIQYEFKVHHVSEIPHYSPFPIAEQYIKVKKKNSMHVTCGCWFPKMWGRGAAASWYFNLLYVNLRNIMFAARQSWGLAPPWCHAMFHDG